MEESQEMQEGQVIEEALPSMEAERIADTCANVPIWKTSASGRSE